MRPDRPDSGTQPAPHYCATAPRPDGTERGCPSWPGCLFPGWTDDEPDDTPTLGQNLAALAGFAAGAVLLLIAAAVLLPLFL